MTELEVLPKNFIPLKYILEFEPIPEEQKFKGKTIIQLDCITPANEIILNGVQLSNIKAKITDSKELTVKEDKDKSRLIIEGHSFIKEKYNIEITYEGVLSDKNMCGFYQSKYELEGETKTICSTQFESCSARRAFPCFDEPIFKSIFDIIMIVPQTDQCFSNMPIKSETLIPNTNKKRVEFESTVKMSTYLVCFINGEFTSISDTSENGIKLGLHYPKCYKEVSDFALKVMSRCLTLYEKTFKIKFPLSKCDWVAIPSFEAGAMENWGCITSRIIEVVLKSDASNQSKKRCASVVCHELAHMWFGDLCTMKWWKDLWLNEGFASFMGDLIGVNTLFPEWNLSDSDYVECVLRALENDGCEGTHAISVPIKKASDIDQLFDAISYSKGSSLIAMMANFVGLDKFIKGICNYLNKYKYSNAESDDMWKCVGDEAGIDLVSIVKEWTYTPGFPLVSVELKDRKLKLKQERFGCKSEQIWKIPMTLKYGEYTTNYVLEHKEAEIDWKYPGVMLNANSNGLYRVKYSEELINQLKTQKLNQREIIGIMDDLYSISKMGKTELKNYLSFLQSIQPFSVKTYQTSRVIVGHLKEILRRFNNEKVEIYIKKELKRLLEPALNSLGIEAKQNESTEDGELRSLCLLQLDNEEVKQKAINTVLNNKVDELAPEMRRPLIFVAGKNADQKVYESLCDMYLNHKIPEIQLLALRALGQCKDENILTQVLDFNWNKVKLQDFYLIIIFASFGKSEKIAEFVEKYMDQINQRYSSGMASIRNHVVEYLLERYSSFDKFAYYQKYFEEHKIEGCEQVIKKGLELINVRAKWVSDNMDSLLSFINN